MTTSSLIELVKNRFPQAVSASHTYRGDETVVLHREFLLEVARFLKEDPACKMNFLMDLTAVATQRDASISEKPRVVGRRGVEALRV